jgi:hypothetical protein
VDILAEITEGKGREGFAVKKENFKKRGSLPVYSLYYAISPNPPPL